MSDLVGNPEDGFSHNEAHMFYLYYISLFVILVVCHFGFKGGTLVLIAPVPGHFLPFTFYYVGLIYYVRYIDL